jgi:hypothetical protein
MVEEDFHYAYSLSFLLALIGNLICGLLQVHCKVQASIRVAFSSCSDSLSPSHPPPLRLAVLFVAFLLLLLTYIPKNSVRHTLKKVNFASCA